MMSRIGLHGAGAVGALCTLLPAAAPVLTLLRLYIDDLYQHSLARVLFGPDGSRIDEGPPDSSGRGKLSGLPVTVPVLKPGTYHVEWVAVARDGHRTEGHYDFTVAPAC